MFSDDVNVYEDKAIDGSRWKQVLWKSDIWAEWINEWIKEVGKKKVVSAEGMV